MLTTTVSRSRLIGRFAKSKAKSKARIVKARFVDQARFVGALVQSPRQTGAIAPTSSELAELMAAHIRLDSALPILELGPGTGSITRAILATGLAPERLMAVEYEHRFCRQLTAQFPGINVRPGDAFDLDAALGDNDNAQFDCVISGLPLLNFSEEKRHALLESVLARLPRGRPFVQFSYGVKAPIETTTPSIVVERSPWVFKNLPPARIWTYSS